MTAISTTRAVERCQLLAALGPPPAWWRVFALRRWLAEYRAIMALDDTRTAKTSDLIAYLSPDIIIAGLGDAAATSEQIDAFILAVAAEIDRRIPVPS